MEILVFFVVLFLIGVATSLSGGRSRRETVERGRELLLSGQLDEALTVFERLAKQRDRNAPGRERALYWLARTQEELGRRHLAEEGYRRYLEEYAFSSAGPRADAETEHLVRERLARLGVSVGASTRDPWARFKHEQARLAAQIRAPDEPARPPVLRTDVPAVEPPVAPPVSAERLARDTRALAVGERVGDYVLAEKLGEGAFGEVFRALRPVAIKLARDPAVVEHLRRFGTIQGGLDSDRVVKPLEVNLEANPPYVVMELVDGCTLRDVLATKRLAPEEALAILVEVALGLKDAHEQGVLHLDLKPENVLLDDSGKVKLTDFELGLMTPEAAQFKLSRTLGSSVQDKIGGTISYMSPEQRDGKVPDMRSDVYTFGVLLFEALTGELPQPGDKPSELRKDLPSLVAPDLDRIFERCFTRLERRFATVGELTRELEAVAAKLPAVDRARLLAGSPEARARVAERAKGPVRPISERVARSEAAVAPREAPRAETPPVETPRVETPRAETPRAETPRAETSRAETPRAERAPIPVELEVPAPTRAPLSASLPRVEAPADEAVERPAPTQRERARELDAG